MQIGRRGFVFFERSDIEALDRDGSGHVTLKDFAPGAGRTLRGVDATGQPTVLSLDALSAGTAARLFEYARQQAGQAGASSQIKIPERLLAETPVDRALLACDSYDTTVRSMDPAVVLDSILDHADPKMGVFSGGLRDASGAFRAYPVVRDGAIQMRTASYDGSKLYLYVPASKPELLRDLQRRAAADPRYANIEVRPITQGQLKDADEIDRLKFDRPGLFYVDQRCPALPELEDTGYLVPGGRFGVELYYHDTRINVPGGRSTVDALLQSGAPGDQAEARRVFSIMRGTVNALCNEVYDYGKIFNSTITPNAGRSQAPTLTSDIIEVYNTWLEVAPEEREQARTWLRWARAAAVKEYQEVWCGAPRLDPKTGLSRYCDEFPSAAPEEDPNFYAGMKWGPDDIASDAAVREHGWDSMTAALASHGPDRGRPRVHHLLPVCLNSLLYRYERDLADIAKELHEPGMEWIARSVKRAETMDQLMWDPARGLYVDLYHPPGTATYQRNAHEDLRSFAPLWAGMVDNSDPRCAAMHARIRDFMRPGGLATTTQECWDKLHAMNPGYVEHCQWGHPDVGWPIATFETAVAAIDSGDPALGHEIAYRWCSTVQELADRHGGVHLTPRGYSAPITEKLDVSRRSLEDAAEIGYGNQGKGEEGEGGGFRWGYDAYKLLYRLLPAELQQMLQQGVPPEIAFSDARARLQLRR